jgi:hypothetical protein
MSYNSIIGYSLKNQLEHMMRKALLSTRNEKDFGESSVDSLMSDGLNLEKLFIIPEMTSVDPCCTNAYQRRFQKECPCQI